MFGGTASRAGAKGKKSEDGAAEALTSRLEQIAESAANPEDAVEPALDAITEASEAAASAICFFDQRQQLLRLAAERGLSDEGCKSLRHVRRGLLGSWDMPLQSLNNRRAYVIQNAAQNRYVPPLIDDPKAMRTVTCLPLFASTTPVGSLILVSTAPRGFTDAQLQSLDRASKTLGRIIESVRARATRTTPAQAADEDAPALLEREQWSRDGMPIQPLGPGSSDRGQDGTMTADSVAERHVEESLSHKLAQARREADRAKELARDWERKHQELAGELAAAAAREQRLRNDLTNTAGQLESFSQSSAAAPPDAKSGAAQVAELARLQASLAEAESIAARERLRASDHERRLGELTVLLQESTEREEDARRRLEAGGIDAAATDASTPRSESAQVARLRARVTDLEATLAAERSRVSTLEETHADLAGRLGESEAKEAAFSDGFHALALEFESCTTDLQDTLATERARSAARIDELTAALAKQGSATADLEEEKRALAQELAATSAREQALIADIETVRSQLQAQIRDIESRDATRAQEIESLTNRLAVAEPRAARLEAAEAERARLTTELDALRSTHRDTEHERTTLVATLEAKLAELTTSLEREQARTAEWEQRHDTIERELSEVVERERARLDAALRAEEEANERAAQAEAKSSEQQARSADASDVRMRLAEVEAAAARATTRATEWEERCTALEASLEAERRERSSIEASLSALRATTAGHQEEGATSAAERSALAERVRELEGAMTEAQRAASESTRRSEHLATELETATARAEAVEHELEILQRNLARERADAQSARAAAAVDEDTVRTRLSESEGRIQALSESLTGAQETIEALQSAERELRREMQGRERELGHARERLEAVTQQLAEAETKAKERTAAEAKIRELEAQLQAMRTAMDDAVTAAEREASATPQTTPSPAAPTASAAPTPKPTAKAAPPRAGGSKAAGPTAATDGAVKRIAVIDAPQRWEGINLHGVEAIPVEPGSDLHARLNGGTAGDRLLVNVSSTAALDTLVAARAAGLTAAACGYLAGPTGDRVLPLGFVEVIPLPVDTDHVLSMLGGFVTRGTRVLMAGSDADVFISLRQALSRSGASVSMAWDGKQGADLLAMVNPEVVVVDLDLPPKGGLDLIARLPQEERVPVVAMIPGRIDQGRNAAATLATSVVTDRLIALDRLLDHARRTTLPKR